MSLVLDKVPSTRLLSLICIVDLREGRIRIVTESTPWPTSTSRIASVNSFGYGGANAHTILEGAESFLYNYTRQKEILRNLLPAHRSWTNHDSHACSHDVEKCISRDPLDIQINLDTRQLYRDHFLLTFSAHNRRTLMSNVAAIRDVSEQYQLTDLAHTLTTRRSSFLERSFVVATKGTMKDKLLPKNLHVQRQRSKSPTLGFVFTGKQRWL